MSRGWKTDGGKNIYFIKVKVARLLHVIDAPNTYKSKHDEEIIWNLKSYQG